MSYLANRPNLLHRRDLALVGLLHLGLGVALWTGLVAPHVLRGHVPPPIKIVRVDLPPVVVQMPPPPSIVEARIDPNMRAPTIEIAPPPTVRTSEGPVVVNIETAPPQVGPIGGDGTNIGIVELRISPLPVPVRIAARASARNRIDESDYPADARRAEQEGAVQVRYTIGTDGRARDCAIVGSSGHASLDRATCTKIEARFRFVPAREGNRAVDEVRAQTVRWILANAN